MSTNIRRIYVLVRPKKGKSTDERVKTILEDPVFTVLREEKPLFQDKIVAIAGDVAELELGIDEKKWGLLTDEVNVIIHAAATINFVETLKVATLTNVRGTREILKLARACKNIKSIVHVSTAYANATKSVIKGEVKEEFREGTINPDTLIQLAESIDEDTLNEMISPLMKQWPNSYTFTKTVTEELIRSQTGCLPICVVRPAIVIGAYDEPSPGWVDPKNTFGPSGVIIGLSFGVTHTILAKDEINIDFVPVDIVNNTIITAGWETNEIYTRGDKKITIYTVSGTRNPITWGKTANVIRKAKYDLLPSQTVWYCFLTETRYKFIYTILYWLLHYIPGLIIDGCCVLIGKKPRLFKIYKLAASLSTVFAYFINNDWIFHDTNTLALFNKLSATDKVIYNFDTSSIDMEKMIWIWCYGIGKYIVKEDFSKLQYALKRQFWLRILHYIIFPLYIYALFKIFYTVFTLIYYVAVLFL